MIQDEPPLLLEPDTLESLLDSPDTGSRIVIIDLCKPTTYAQAHIPGAIHLDYPQIVAVNNPVMGLLPDKETLSQLFSRIGLTKSSHVVAYDDEGGGRAARLIWTLDAIGHNHASILNGGLHAWIKEGHPCVNTEKRHEASHYDISTNEIPENNPVADRKFILSNLNNENVLLLDSRSPEEYRGEKKFAAKAGRIPGAINLDWFLVIDKDKNMRLKSESELKALLKERGISEDKTIVTYCQTHHRSALTYFVLKLLGYEHIKGYHGSWSDWGNQENTPVETG
jgi:thiosulfate/3-mercaptopyruvate sulfurtransferase